MRVLHVIPGLASRTGGPAFAVVGSALALRSLGVESTVVTTDLAAAASGDRGRVSPDELPRGAAELDVRLLPARRPFRLAYSPALAAAVSDEAARADVVHIHSLYLLPQLSGYRAANKLSRPYVVSPHGALDPWLGKRGRVRKRLTDALWQSRMLKRAAALHVTSEEEARLIDGVAPNVPRAVVPIGIRWDDFQTLPSPGEFRNRYLRGHSGPVVLFLGRLTFKKGLDVLVAGFARAAVPDAVLAIVGPDDERMQPGLESLAKQAGIGSRIVFTGMLRGEDKAGALAAADVWALPSHTENFGLAVVEALAAGRPVLLSPAVNIAHEAGAARAATICEPDANEFGYALAALLADHERRAELGSRAREFARRYDWPEVAPRWKEMYEGAVGSK
jgi:glycosyltransferase involved in cell wall biosynthesis